MEKIILPDVKHIIVVASGKGGVGKSTVSANLAVSLALKGFKTALADADIYGPSIPHVFAIEDQNPEIVEFQGIQFMMPVEKHGVKINSMGFFAPPKQGMIWRGPMAAAAITQLLKFTHWEETDFLIIDLPPGTGDIQLSILQQLNVSGALLVTTPHQMALIDARRAASQFTHPEVNTNIIGIVENMSWFTPAAHPDEKYFLFGKHGGNTLADELNVPLLAQIPMMAEIGESAEKGNLASGQHDLIITQMFNSIASYVLAFADKYKSYKA